MEKGIPAELENWDPLGKDEALDQTLLFAAQRREVKNILKSYTGSYDLFCELLQNSLDAVERRQRDESTSPGYSPTVWLTINMKEKTVSITDNGTGLTHDQLKHFLRPNISFKSDGRSRGNKGVGATYLAYGFNYLQVGTRIPGFEYVGSLHQGRAWVEDTSESEPRPRLRPSSVDDPNFNNIDQGATFTIKLTGKGIRPKNLAWVGATTADQWVKILRVHTPIGGIHLSPTTKVKCIVHVEDANGAVSTAEIGECTFLYPHQEVSNCIDLKQILENQKRRAEQGLPPGIPDKFKKLNGLYGEFSGDEILAGTSIVKPTLDEEQKELLTASGANMYVFFAYSTSLWDAISAKAGLRNGYRLLRGGLQLATNGMPQGPLITIPLTQSIGYQNTTLVIVHFKNAEPDLGRKGFQPEYKELAEDLAKAAVSAFKRWKESLKVDSGELGTDKEYKHEEWVREQETHAEKFPLVITGKALFAPTEEVPIASAPQTEQDVVALYNQLLAAGVVRGFKILATSSHEQYDGIFRIDMSEPYDRYIFDEETNPLGVSADAFESGPRRTYSKTLEYKWDLDALLEEFDRETKDPNLIDLAIVWRAGSKWKQNYEVTSLLLFESAHHRPFHGLTHIFKLPTGQRAFYAVVLEDLVRYLQNPHAEQDVQRHRYSSD